MIQAKRRKELNIDTILSMVSEYQVFRWYLGRDFKLNQPINSPFRQDDNPSFSVMATKNGRLYYTDFGNSQYRGTFIDLVQQLFNVDYPTALQKIDSDMGLGIVTKATTDYKKIVKTYKEPKIEKIDTFIQVKSKRFDLSELNYWKQFHISEQELKDNNVYSVKKLWINRVLYPISPTDMCFGYLLDDAWKIYWPTHPKGDKWKSNVSIDRMWGMDSIKPGCGNVVVTKALKDMIVLKKFLPSVAAVQNESTVSINNTNIEILQKNCKQVFLNFDADEAGIVNCTFYNQYGFRWVNTPRSILPVKDFADMAKVHGMQAVIDYFKSKGII